MRWTGIVPGREAAAMKLMRDSNALTDRLVAEGRITDYAWYLSAHSGDGFSVARGEMEQLMAITAGQEFLALNARSRLVLTDCSWGFYATGESVGANGQPVGAGSGPIGLKS
jgi:hypothetical protein